MKNRSKFIACAIVFSLGVFVILNIGNKSALDIAIGNSISMEKSLGNITDASVYVQNLNTGATYGFQEDKKYEPRSMFKVIDLIGYLKASVSDPLVLDEMKTYNPFFGQGVHYEVQKLKFGQYPVSTLLAQLITQSDDAALQALLAQDQSNKIYIALGLPLFKDGEAYYISSKDASKMFVALYRNTVLPKAQSDQAINLLLQTKFTEGLVGQLPPSVKVAHKFGENARLGASGGVVGYGLNDCGIVYAKDPYVICVMTLGSSFDGLEKTIQKVSWIVYENISILDN